MKGGFKGNNSHKGTEVGRVGGWDHQHKKEMESGGEIAVGGPFRSGKRHQSLHHPPIEESVADGELEYPISRDGRHEQWQS